MIERRTYLKDKFQDFINWNLVSFIEYLLTELDDASLITNMVVGVLDKHNNNIRVWSALEENYVSDCGNYDFEKLKTLTKYKMTYYIYIRSMQREGSKMTSDEFKLMSSNIYNKINNKCEKSGKEFEISCEQENHYDHNKFKIHITFY